MCLGNNRPVAAKATLHQQRGEAHQGDYQAGGRDERLTALVPIQAFVQIIQHTCTTSYMLSNLRYGAN